MALLRMKIISFFETILGRLILKFEASVQQKVIHTFIHSQKITLKRFLLTSTFASFILVAWRFLEQKLSKQLTPLSGSDFAGVLLTYVVTVVSLDPYLHPP